MKTKNTILNSKVQVPMITKEILIRQVLFDEIENAEEKVIVLNAGAGYGKTTLLAYYTNQSDNICVWYYLTYSDNDMISFMQYLSSSIKRQVNHFAFEIEPYQNAVWTKNLIYEVTEEFLWELSMLQEEKIVIILDDFQVIQNNNIKRMIASLIHNTGENIKIILATKASVPSFIAKYILEGKAKTMGIKDLAFSEEEIETLLLKMIPTEESHLIAGMIFNYSEGWPAGVMSILLRLRQEYRKIKNKDNIAEICRESTIYDYIMNEIYIKLPYELQKFLIETSILEVLDIDSCNYLLKRNNAESTLDYLLQENLFVIKIYGEKTQYHYHSIFKDFLMRQLSEERKKNLYDKLVAFYLKKGKIEQAMEYAMNASNIERMEKILEDAGTDFIKKGKPTLLERWFDFISQNKEKLNPETVQMLDFYAKERKQQEPSQPIMTPIERLKVHCFGEFEIYVGPLQEKLKWRTRKAKEIIAYLFTKKGKAIEKEEIIEALWPNILSENANINFHTTLSYARKTFITCGYTDIIRCSEKKYSLNMDGIEDERTAFEKCTLDLKKNGYQKREQQEKMMNLYRGNYMGKNEYFWLRGEVENYERLFLKACRIFIKEDIVQKRYEEALGILQRTFEIDTYIEENIADVIKIYGYLGDKQTLKKKYLYFEGIFKEELNIGLPKWIETIYKQEIQGISHQDEKR
ncbi:MAG: BTAD domain-containing putative transcriptional regulator [Acetivibrio sp.]